MIREIVKALANPNRKTRDFAREGGFEFIDPNSLTIFKDKDRLLEIYEESLIATGSEWDSFQKRCRFFNLAQLFERVLDENPHGDIAECGCFRGHSTHVLATLARQHSFKGLFHVFDSFEGLSELSDEDRVGLPELTTEQRERQAKWFACPEDVVRANLSEFPFVRTYKGWIPDRFDEVEHKRFSFVHIDLDLFRPIADSMDFFFIRMLKGGIVVFDDYGSSRFPGAKRAIDAAVKKFRPSFFYRSPTGGAFLIA